MLGTGAADAWPNPWCSCASCRWARSNGRVRTTTSVLVDRELLLDCGPDAPRQADRAGIGLGDVVAILLTHAHPDHLAPEALLARSWAGPATPLRVLGPQSALDGCAHWIGPRDDVRLELVQPGDVVTIGSHVVRVLAAAHDASTGSDTRDVLTSDAVLYDVTGPDGRRILYATDTGPLPHTTVEATRDAAYDVVLLEETFGVVADHGTGHLDLTTFPRELARLRDAGAVTDATDVVAVHLGHHNPPGPELDRILGGWGVRAVDDLTVVVAGDAIPREPAPRRFLLLGGARSGKSHEAERLLAAEPLVRYVATGGRRDDDPEWQQRIDAHRRRRPAGWTTVETVDVAALLHDHDGTPVLVDCLALWLAAHLDAAGVWAAEPGSPARQDALDLVAAETDELVRALRSCAGTVVLVSNEVGSGVVPEHASGRLYRDLLGRLNARVAAECDDVALVVAGRRVRL